MTCSTKSLLSSIDFELGCKRTDYQDFKLVCTGFGCVYVGLSAFVQKGTVLVMFSVYGSERKPAVMFALKCVFSFEYDDLSKMWYSDAVESAGWTLEMKTAAVL